MTTEQIVRPTSHEGPTTIAAQGSFAVGGTVVTRDGSFDPRKPMNPAGQTLHGDHARVTFQVPASARGLPLLFWHGWWSDSSCWDTTPDGREGFRTLFLRRGFPVYLLDQPRRGSAGKTTIGGPVSAEPNEQWFFNQFRLGVWPGLYDGGQFAADPAALAQFFRAMVPDTGPLDAEVIVAAASAAIDRIGDMVLVTHSHAGGFGWSTVLRNRNVRAVVSIEPGSGFVFPEGELPEAMPSSNGTLEPVPVPVEEFQALTRVPIIVYYGDNIPTQPTDIAGRDNWRVRQDMARVWVDAVNRQGGDATFVSLPERGIHGNTHFAFSDLNNREIADQITAFLTEKSLAGPSGQP
jgi:pimeloyl-ACP methyl ester carboxylesterase